MILYWALIVGLCGCSLTESTWLYRSESSGDDGWSANDVFPGLYTTDKDGLLTLSIPPHALEMTLAYLPVESAKECSKSLLYDDMACYSAYEGTDFNLIPDKVYQVKWSDTPLSKNTSRHVLLTLPQPIKDSLLPGIEVLDAPLMSIDETPNVKQVENSQSITLPEHPPVQLTRDNNGPRGNLQEAKTVVLPITSLKSRTPAPAASIAQLRTNPICIRPVSSRSQLIPEIPVGRAVWFNNGIIRQFFSPNILSDQDPQIAFCRHHIYGVTNPYKQATYLAGRNAAAGYRINHDRIIFLDGYKIKDKVQQQKPRHINWSKRFTDRATLEVERFRTVYPLKKDGLVVALQEGLTGNHQLLMASYGKPPLGVILLRPEKNRLLFVARTSDDTVKSLKVRNSDVVVVGPLLGISNAALKALVLSTSDTLATIAKKVYDSAAEASLCVVATISVVQKLQPNIASVPRESVESRDDPFNSIRSPPQAMHRKQFRFKTVLKEATSHCYPHSTRQHHY